MPIYAYRCEACDFEKDVLQKLSDVPLTQCPSCGKASFAKQVTAAGFQLKGSGWYVTDFRSGNGGGNGTNKPKEAQESSADRATNASDSSSAAPAEPATKSATKPTPNSDAS